MKTIILTLIGSFLGSYAADKVIKKMREPWKAD